MNSKSILLATLLTLGVAASLWTVAAITLTPIAADFQAGDTLSADALNALFDRIDDNFATTESAINDLLDGVGPSGAWSLTGNADSDPQDHFLGTTDAAALVVRVGGQQAFAFEPTASVPNVIGGFGGNGSDAGVVGASIGGGGGAGVPNEVAADFGTVGGGFDNRSGGFAATVAGGQENAANGNQAVVGGGRQNSAGGTSSTVAGGASNVAAALGSTVGGGTSNRADNSAATVSGGDGNEATGLEASVGGGRNNAAAGGGATVSGGVGNTASGIGATVAGGGGNEAGGSDASVGGGRRNVASGAHATVGGGEDNVASAAHATIGGGSENEASDLWATVGGGQFNLAPGRFGTIAGGVANTVEGFHGTIGGGIGNRASGAAATVPGGLNNHAAGTASFAAGRLASAAHEGSFVWADATADALDPPFASTAAHQFSVRAAGGTRVFSNAAATTGVQLAPGGNAWSSLSDRSVKENVVPVEADVVLERLSQLPIATWNLTSQDPSIRHLGPMAQDFHAAFGLGESDTHISATNASGVAFAAIQELHRLASDQEARIAELERRNAELAALVADLAITLEQRGQDDAHVIAGAPD